MCVKDKRFNKSSVLVKITSSKYAEDLMNGNLYCNSVDYFRKNGKENQKDENEGIAYCYKNGKKFKIKYNGTDVYLYCLYNMQPNNCFLDTEGRERLYYKMAHEDSEKFKCFFTNLHDASSVTIDKVDDFIQKINDFCTREKIEFCHAEVEYYDLKKQQKKLNDLLIEKPMTALFCKNIEFASQKEYRFAFWGNETKKYLNSQGALVLPLGTIEDMAVKSDNIFGVKE